MAKTKYSYSLPTLTKTEIPFIKRWLAVSVTALAIAGIFAILLVLARTPGFQKIIPFIDFFHTALIIHVNLSVLVWLLCMACLLFAFISKQSANIYTKTAAYLSLAGMAVMALSAFVGDAHPLINNYVPVLQTPLFFFGLGIFCSSVVISIGVLFFYLGEQIKQSKQLAALDPVRFGIYGIAFTIAVALICFYLSYIQVSAPDVFPLLDRTQFYELTFWAGGHILQYAYTLMMLLSWILMASHIKLSPLPSPAILLSLFVLHVALVIPAPFVHMLVAITDFAHIDFYTQHMRWGAGIASVVIGAYLLIAFIKHIDKFASPFYQATLWSFILFVAGGVIGFLISGSNVIIPAHYHGSIVGITLAMMGVAYLLVEKLKIAKLPKKLTAYQPVFYGGGQLLHVLGFAISGGYGTLRKTPGAAQSFEGQLAMGLMGLGGLISVIGGLIFVYIVIVAFRSKGAKKK